MRDRPLGDRLVLTCVFTLAAGAAACAKPGSGSGSGSVEGYLHSLPAWPAPKANSDAPSGAAVTTNNVLGSDNKYYTCSTTPYTLTSTPQQIVTFNPNADVLWPGALLQGKALQSGVLAGLPITQRAPIAVSIPGLLDANNTVTVQNPDLASVQQGVGALINAAVQAGVKPSSSISYQETEAHSNEQAALNLGISANYLGFSLDSTFNYKSDASLHTVLVYFVQNMFTVAVPEPEQPSDLFSGLTDDELNAQVQAGNIGPDNLPVYVASVTYGRILMFSITSTSSATDIEASLNAAYMGAGGGASGSGQYQLLLTNSATEIHLATVGGDAINAEAMIQSGDPSQFFASDPSISTGVPISYVLRNLGDNSIAAVSETTSYSVQTCQESSDVTAANYYVVNGADGSIQTFDTQGNPVALSQPITGLGNPSGIAYDFADDLLFVTVAPGGTPGVQVFTPTGFSMNPSNANWQLDEPTQLITYDPAFGRLYVTEPGNDVKAFTTAGLLAKTYSLLDVTNAIFDSDDGDLFATFSSAPAIERLQLSGGNVPLPDSAFSGVSSPVLGYDPHHDLILVAQSGSLSSYLPDGTQVATTTLPGTAQSLAYDDVDDQIAVVDPAGTVYLYTWDMKRVTGLPEGAFRGLANPLGIAYRP